MVKFLLAIHHARITACGHSDLLCSHSHITSVSDLSFPRRESERKGKYPVQSFDRHTQGTVSRGGKVSKTTVKVDKEYQDEEER